MITIKEFGTLSKLEQLEIIDGIQFWKDIKNEIEKL